MHLHLLLSIIFLARSHLFYYIYYFMYAYLILRPSLTFCDISFACHCYSLSCFCTRFITVTFPSLFIIVIIHHVVLDYFLHQSKLYTLAFSTYHITILFKALFNKFFESWTCESCTVYREGNGKHDESKTTRVSKSRGQR